MIKLPPGCVKINVLGLGARTDNTVIHTCPGGRKCPTLQLGLPFN